MLQTISVVGALTILGAYAASQFGLADASKLSYQAANFLGSLEMAALAFGFGAVHLGLGQLWASEDRGGRVIGVGKGPATVRREEFLGALSGERGRRAKEPANEFAPRTSVGKARDF